MFRALTILSTFSSFFTPLRASTIYPTFSLGNVDGISGSVFNGVSTSDQSGTAVVNAGDLNGDGKTDFAIGAPGMYNGGTTAGKVYVIYGSDTGFNAAVDLSTLDGNNGFVMTGEQINDGFGAALAGGRGKDFNGDGIDDLAIGAPYALSSLGKAYVIYGSPSFNATFSMATLGAQGFVINGYGASGYTGFSVALASDFNGNGFTDLVIAATNNAGLVAVVFGTNKTISALNVSALNGTNGFVMPGIFVSGQSGSVASGDINGDGLGEILVGAPNVFNHAGAVFVVFGANKSFSKNLNVSSLNGTDGFSIRGILAGDNFGSSVSASSDFNGDGIDDVLASAPFASPKGKINAGSLFVLLGGPYFKATVDLSKLNGTDGFTINGQFAGDNLGFSCISGGYINGDPFGDVVVGLPYTSPVSSAFPGGLYQAGSTFVIFGTNESVAAALDLPGTNDKVLRIDGFQANMNSGSCVGSADIRRDGNELSALIIGAPGYSPSATAVGGGSTYALYGDNIDGLENLLNISAGETLTVTPSELNAVVPNNPGYTQYTITEIQHVQFEYTDQPGVPITGFSGQDISTGRVKVTHDDSELAPSYLVSALHTLAATTASPANVTFKNQLPKLVNYTVIIDQGKTIRLDNTMLAAVDPNNALNNPGIDVSFLDCLNGYPIPPSFPQSQLLAGGVYFTQDNSVNSPQCSVTIGRGGFTSNSTPLVFNFDTTPVLDQNHFDICQGQTKLVTATMLSAIHPGANSSDPLVFSVNNVQYGYFERVNASGVAILAFSQAEIQNSSILFVHDGSPNPPSFMVTVSDGRITTPLTSAAPYFTYAPVLTSNTLTLDQGQTTILNSNMLKAVNPNLNSLSEDLIFTVSNVEGGTFIKVNTTQNNITQFNQSQVSANAIAFESDGSSNMPSYDVSVANHCSQTPPSAAAINYNYIPSITANQLTITDGQPVILTSAQLAAIDLGQGTSPGNLVFAVSDVENGYFDATTLPGTQIDVFSQQRVFNGEIRFVPKSSSLLPAYNVTVRDGGGLSYGPQEALVTLKHTPPATTTTVVVDSSSNSNTAADTLRNSLISFFGVTVPLGIVFWLGKRYLDKRMNSNLENLLKSEHSSVAKADEAWKNNTVFPVLKEVFSRIQTATGGCGYRNEEATRGYIQGIEKLLGQLRELGVNINLNELPDHERSGFKSAIADEIQERAKWGKPPRSAFSKCCATLLSASSGPVFTASALQKTAEQIAEVIAATYKKDLEENYIARFRKAVYDEYPTRPEVKQRQTLRKGRGESLELTDLSGSGGTEEKFGSEQLQELATRVTQLEAEFAKRKEQKEAIATSSDGPFVDVGARGASAEKSQKTRDTVVTVSSARKSEASVRVA